MITPHTRTVTVTRHEYLIPSPATHRDLEDTLAQVRDRMIAVGYDTSTDDAIMVESHDDQILVWWSEVPEVRESGTPRQTRARESVDIADLGLSSRLYNALYGRGVRTLADLESWSEDKVLRMPNIGEGSLFALKMALRPYSMVLPEFSPDDLKSGTLQ